jgi:hypothetical protein
MEFFFPSYLIIKESEKKKNFGTKSFQFGEDQLNVKFDIL